MTRATKREKGTKRVKGRKQPQKQVATRYTLKLMGLSASEMHAVASLMALNREQAIFNLSGSAAAVGVPTGDVLDVHVAALAGGICTSIRRMAEQKKTEAVFKSSFPYSRLGIPEIQALADKVKLAGTQTLAMMRGFLEFQKTAQQGDPRMELHRTTPENGKYH